jgi:hypothetical protein
MPAMASRPAVEERTSSRSDRRAGLLGFSYASQSHVNEARPFYARPLRGEVGAFPHGLFLPRAEGISKKLGRSPLEFFPKSGRAVTDGPAAVVTKDLLDPRDFGGISLVFDAVNPFIATIAVEGRLFLRGQHFHSEFILRSPRPSEFGAPLLWPKRNN